jgi:hypothetical protein
MPVSINGKLHLSPHECLLCFLFDSSYARMCFVVLVELWHLLEFAARIYMVPVRCFCSLLAPFSSYYSFLMSVIACAVLLLASSLVSFQFAAYAYECLCIAKVACRIGLFIQLHGRMSWLTVLPIMLHFKRSACKLHNH